MSTSTMLHELTMPDRIDAAFATFLEVVREESRLRGRDHVRAKPWGRVLDAMNAGLAHPHPDDQHAVCPELAKDWELLRLQVRTKKVLGDWPERDQGMFKLAQAWYKAWEGGDEPIGICEGCNLPAFHSDGEGVPLCTGCWDALLEESGYLDDEVGLSNKQCRNAYQGAAVGNCSCPEGRCWYTEQRERRGAGQRALGFPLWQRVVAEDDQPPPLELTPQVRAAREMWKASGSTRPFREWRPTPVQRAELAARYDDEPGGGE